MSRVDFSSLKCRKRVVYLTSTFLKKTPIRPNHLNRRKMLSVNLFECDMQWKKVEVVRIPSSAYQQTEQPQRIKLSATDSTNKDVRDREKEV